MSMNAKQCGDGLRSLAPPPRSWPPLRRPRQTNPRPNCTAADLAGVLTGVSAALSAYLFTHPDVNDFYTDLKGMPRDQQRDAVQTYFDAHPQMEADLEGIRGACERFRDSCDVELPS